ncbi:hypothetical protein BDZ91DRAFT_768025 [Kalaharituber pfeilii]|nr:hypothetical protein BDZ91DRAFT_768025 [Kalaharituber pfeilii]
MQRGDVIQAATEALCNSNKLMPQSLWALCRHQQTCQLLLVESAKQSPGKVRLSARWHYNETMRNMWTEIKWEEGRREKCRTMTWTSIRESLLLPLEYTRNSQVPTSSFASLPVRQPAEPSSTLSSGLPLPGHVQCQGPPQVSASHRSIPPHLRLRSPQICRNPLYLLLEASHSQPLINSELGKIRGIRWLRKRDVLEEEGKKTSSVVIYLGKEMDVEKVRLSGRWHKSVRYESERGRK